MIDSRDIHTILETFQRCSQINKDEGLEAALKVIKDGAHADPENAIGLWWPVEAIAKMVSLSLNDEKINQEFESSLRAYEQKPTVEKLGHFLGLGGSPVYKGEVVLFEANNPIFCRDVQSAFDNYSKDNDFGRLRFTLSVPVVEYHLDSRAAVILTKYVDRNKVKRIVKRTIRSEAMIICDVLTRSTNIDADMSDRCSAYFIERLMDIAPPSGRPEPRDLITYAQAHGKAKIAEDRSPQVRWGAQQQMKVKYVTDGAKGLK